MSLVNIRYGSRIWKVVLLIIAMNVAGWLGGELIEQAVKLLMKSALTQLGMLLAACLGIGFVVYSWFHPSGDIAVLTANKLFLVTGVTKTVQGVSAEEIEELDRADIVGVRYRWWLPIAVLLVDFEAESRRLFLLQPRIWEHRHLIGEAALSLGEFAAVLKDSTPPRHNFGGLWRFTGVTGALGLCGVLIYLFIGPKWTRPDLSPEQTAANVLASVPGPEGDVYRFLRRNQRPVFDDLVEGYLEGTQARETEEAIAERMRVLLDQHVTARVQKLGPREINLLWDSGTRQLRHWSSAAPNICRKAIAGEPLGALRPFLTDELMADVAEVHKAVFSSDLQGDLMPLSAIEFQTAVEPAVLAMGTTFGPAGLDAFGGTWERVPDELICGSHVVFREALDEYISGRPKARVVLTFYDPPGDSERMDNLARFFPRSLPFPLEPPFSSGSDPNADDLERLRTNAAMMQARWTDLRAQSTGLGANSGASLGGYARAVEIALESLQRALVGGNTKGAEAALGTASSAIDEFADHVSTVSLLKAQSLRARERTVRAQVDELKARRRRLTVSDRSTPTIAAADETVQRLDLALTLLGQVTRDGNLKGAEDQLRDIEQLVQRLEISLNEVEPGEVATNQKARALERKWSHLSARVTGIEDSLSNLRARQSRIGVTLRGDMAAHAVRMRSELELAARAIEDGDLDAAVQHFKSTDYAIRQLETTLKF